MTDLINRRILLDSRPVGEPVEGNFLLDPRPVREPEDGEVLLKVLWLSLDPYMRGRMNDAESYAPPVKIGEVMTGETVCQVMRSKSAKYTEGEYVAGHFGWQEFVTINVGSSHLRKVNPAFGPVSTALGILGMTGLTAYFGLLRVGKPNPGETVVVSAASGAVGSVVGQIAKIKGCRVVGIAGGKIKCDYIVHELGFDEAVDYKAGNLDADLKKACPEGIDVYFEGVGGAVLHAVVPLLNKGARVPICGFISQYNATSTTNVEYPTDVLGALPHPPEHRFFLVGEWFSEFEETVEILAGWLKEGKLKYRESIVNGIENAPKAFIGLLRGENFGKQLIKVAELE
jgi:NADPH-dependent curcumin reductase CurA